MAEKMERTGGIEERDQDQVDPTPAILQDEETSDESTLGEAIFSAELEKRIGERIAAEVERQFQSAKDKRWARLERQIRVLTDRQRVNGVNMEIEAEADPSANDEAGQRKQVNNLPEGTRMSDDLAARNPIQSSSNRGDLENYLEVLGDITEMVLQRAQRKRGRPATVMQPTGGGRADPDLRSEYDLRKGKLRPGDVNGLLELKREYRKKGMQIY